MKAYIKIAIALAILAVGFSIGHWIASNSWEAKLNQAKADFSVEREGWANERLAITTAAAKQLEQQIAEADDRETQLRKAYRAAEVKYAKRIKELENELSKITELANDYSDIGGLWINVEAKSCPASSSQFGPNLPEATGSAKRSPDTIRCRIAREDAQALIEIGYTADSRTEILNKCIGVLNKQVKILAPVPADADSSADDIKIKPDAGETIERVTQ